MRSGNPGTTSRSGIRRRFGPTRLSLRRPTSMERVGTKVRIGYNRTSGDGRSSSHVHSPRSPSSRRSCDRGPRMATCSPRDLDPTDSIGHRVPPNQRPRATTAIAGCRLTPNFRTPNFKPARRAIARSCIRRSWAPNTSTKRPSDLRRNLFVACHGRLDGETTDHEDGCGPSIEPFVRRVSRFLVRG